MKKLTTSQINEAIKEISSDHPFYYGSLSPIYRENKEITAHAPKKRKV